jgi:hypothetical protein
MSLKKQPNQLTDDELLATINDAANPEPIEKPTEHSVLQFLADMSIYPGTNYIRGTLLYKLYKQYTESPVTTMEFHTLLKGYLEYTEATGPVLFQLNRHAFELTKQLADFLVKKNKLKKVNTRHYRKHFEDYLAAYSIKKGTQYIQAAVLFFLYDKWQYNRKTRTRLNFATFNAMMKLYYKTKRTVNVWLWIQIDKDHFYKQFTQEEINTALAWAAKFNGNHDQKKIDKKKKQKNPKQIPSPKS